MDNIAHDAVDILVDTKLGEPTVAADGLPRCHVSRRLATASCATLSTCLGWKKALGDKSRLLQCCSPLVE